MNARGDIGSWTPGHLGDVETAFVGPHHTQATDSQAEGLVSDERLRGKSVWMLNLLKYEPDGGKARHDAYVESGGNDFPGGNLGRQYGVRLAYPSRRAFRTLIGETDWDSVAIATYPSPDHFLSMGANTDFIRLHEGRETGLADTYIVAMQPTVF